MMTAVAGLLSGAPSLSIHKNEENTRRLVHFGFGFCAFLLPWTGLWGGVALALAALLYNAWIAPRLGLDAGYRRDGEGRWSGLVTYPLAVLLLLLLTPREVAAGAWMVMASADPIAAAVGTRRPRPPIPWNRRKSIIGSAAGFLAGWALTSVLLARMGVQQHVGASACAAGAGILAESLPLPTDDNLPMAAAAALALWPWIA